MKRGETGSSFTCIDLHAASNREDSEKLRLLRPVCLGDDVRDIRVLGGSAFPSIAPSHSRPPSAGSRSRCLFLRLLRAGDADRFVARIVPSRGIWQPARHYTMTRQSYNTRGERKGGEGDDPVEREEEKYRSGYKVHSDAGFRDTCSPKPRKKCRHFFLREVRFQ